MARTKVFVSYSHKDAGWLKRFQEHIALLERLDLVDLWADTRIAGGSEWEREIDVALTNAKVAVLLVSPAFLDSKFIWAKEMPRIEAHCREGMEALPLIIRSCAWRLEPFLAKLMARPRDGEALSLMNDGEIDLELSKRCLRARGEGWEVPGYGLTCFRGRIAARVHIEEGSKRRPYGEVEWFYNSTRQIRLEVHGQNAGSFPRKNGVSKRRNCHLGRG